MAMNVLVLASHAYGGRGGIAKFNRDMLSSLISHEAVDGITVLPRVIDEEPGDIPAGIDFVAEAAGSASRYVAAAGRAGLVRRYGLVICAHINLLPLARVAALRSRAPLWLVIHGVDAWQPTGRRAVDRLIRGIDLFISVSDFTRHHFSAWSGVPLETGVVIPNAIDRSRFGPGEKPTRLLDLYGLHDQVVIMTLGRISSLDRYKGFDEVLDVLPALAREIPNIAYLIVGDGDDRKRLERKAHNIGMGDRVRFTGYVSEEDKADHYRLADAFVMPGHGEGFGIVYLEALACGIPVVASSRDASSEAVLDGELGEIVDPRSSGELKDGIRAALSRGRGRVPDGLSHFDFDRFKERWDAVVNLAFMNALQSESGEHAEVSAT